MGIRLFAGFVSVLLSSSVAGVFASAPPQLPTNDLHTYYYADEAHEILIGEREYDCNGDLLEWGDESPIRIVQREACIQPPSGSGATAECYVDGASTLCTSKMCASWMIRSCGFHMCLHSENGKYWYSEDC